MKRQAILTKSVGTKVSEAELGRLEEFARDRGLNLSTWVRQALLATIGGAATTAEEVALGEILALRSIIINLLFSISQGQSITTESMTALIERSDAEKMRRASERIAAVREPERGSKPNAM